MEAVTPEEPPSRDVLKGITWDPASENFEDVLDLIGLRITVTEKGISVHARIPIEEDRDWDVDDKLEVLQVAMVSTTSFWTPP